MGQGAEDIHAKQIIRLAHAEPVILDAIHRRLNDDLEDAKARLALLLHRSTDTDNLATALLRCETRCIGKTALPTLTLRDPEKTQDP